MQIIGQFQQGIIRGLCQELPYSIKMIYRCEAQVKALRRISENAVKRNAQCEIADAADASRGNPLDLKIASFAELVEPISAVRQTFKNQRCTATTVELTGDCGFPG